MEKYKNIIITELKSFLTTFMAVFIIEGGATLLAIYNGIWTEAVLTALGIAIARSAVKSILILLFPQLFKK